MTWATMGVVDEKSLGQAIRQARKQRRMSQEQLAVELGVHKTTVRNWEAGRNAPNNLAAVERTLGMAITSETPSSSDSEAASRPFTPPDWDAPIRTSVFFGGDALVLTELERAAVESDITSSSRQALLKYSNTPEVQERMHQRRALVELIDGVTGNLAEFNDALGGSTASTFAAPFFDAPLGTLEIAISTRWRPYIGQELALPIQALRRAFLKWDRSEDPEPRIVAELLISILDVLAVFGIDALECPRYPGRDIDFMGVLFIADIEMLRSIGSEQLARGLVEVDPFLPKLVPARHHYRTWADWQSPNESLEVFRDVRDRLLSLYEARAHETSARDPEHLQRQSRPTSVKTKPGFDDNDDEMHAARQYQGQRRPVPLAPGEESQVPPDEGV